MLLFAGRSGSALGAQARQICSLADFEHRKLAVLIQETSPTLRGCESRTLHSELISGSFGTWSLTVIEPIRP